MPWRIAVTGLLVATLCPYASGLADDFALLVAVGDYDRTELKPLRFTRNDILEFRDLLLNSGFRKQNVVVLHDDVKKLDDLRYVSEAQKIRRELKLLAGSVQRGDTLIVAFAGHGVQFKDEPDSYFCPRDARLADRRTLLPFTEVLKVLDSCAATRKLLLVDACRNDPQTGLARSRDSVSLESVTRPQTAKIPESLVAVFSCSEGQQSYEDPDLKHGIFFHHVLEGWRGKADSDHNRQLSLNELQSFVRRETSAWARTRLKTLQTPQIQAEVSDEWILRRLSPTALFQQNSVWRTDNTRLRFIVQKLSEKEFVARLSIGGQIDREVHGTINDDRIAWLASDVKPRRGGAGGDNTGRIRGNVIEMQFRGPGEFAGTFAMKFAAPDAFQEASVWKHASSNTTLTVLEREGNRFVSRFVSGTAFDREVSGTISDDRVTWRAADVRPKVGNAGGDNVGVIHGDRIDFTWMGPGDQSGKFTLRLD